VVLNISGGSLASDAPDQGASPVVFLHGLLGSGRNWMAMASRFEGGFPTLALDARNHGNSGHGDLMDYSTMASDVAETLDSLGVGKTLSPVHLSGHSMGGKTAMELALTRGSLVKSLIIVDIAPRSYPPGYQDAIESLADMDVASITSRKGAMEALAQRVPDVKLRGFLLTNLKRVDRTTFKWGINLDGIRQNYESIWKGIDRGRTFQGPVLVVRGSDSNYIKSEDESLFRSFFPQVKFVTIPGAGHWVHVDQPDLLYNQYLSFIGTQN